MYPLMRPADRLAALESIMGIWKNRRPDPVKELQKMRRERERKIPLLHWFAMYTLDTNAIIYYSKGDTKVSEIFHGIFIQNIPLYISTITEIELFGFSQLTEKDIEWFENFLKATTIISVDSRVAKIAGSLRRDFKLKTLDSAIAATALMTGTTLVTRNIRDFKKVPNLRLLEI